MDPRACAFDPASMRCANGADQPNCLTEEQVRVVRDEYRGPSDKDGHGLFDGGEPYGSELAWANWLVMPAADAAAPADSYAAGIGLAFLNDMAFMPNHPGKYALGSVPFTAAMHQQLEQLGGIYNATDPDLSAFAANGGKLIIYHSWADQAIPPFASINYYRAVVGQAGGLPAAQSFSRLYMVPGLYHCPCGQPVDGDPATTVQFMPQLVAWVERGEAPGSITLPVTSQTTGTHAASIGIEPFDPRNQRRTTTGSTATITICSRRASISPTTRFGAPIEATPWPARGGNQGRPTTRSGGLEQAELGQRGDAVVEADFLGDFAVDHLQTVVPVKRILRPVAAGRLPTRKSLKAGPVCVPPPSHRPTTVSPSAIRSAVPQKLRSGNAARKSVMNALMSSRPRRGACSEYFKQHVRRGDLVDDREIHVLAPEFGEPSAHHGLVVVLLAHGNGSSRSCQRIIEVAR